LRFSAVSGGRRAKSLPLFTPTTGVGSHAQKPQFKQYNQKYNTYATQIQRATKQATGDKPGNYNAPGKAKSHEKVHAGLKATRKATRGI
jgi:hypothetical protein